MSFLLRLACSEALVLLSLSLLFSQKSVNYGDMQSQNWSVYRQGYGPDADDGSDEEGTIRQPSPPQIYEEEQEEDEEDEQTVRPAQTLSATQRAIMERKMQAADARAHLFK